MFTQSCFIRKNSKKLQDKLRNLGYDICCCCNFKNAIWLDTFILDGRHDVHGIGYIDEEIGYMGIDTVEKRLNFFLSENEKSENKSIDCGENEELFLAIAALRDDSDYMQWFVCNEDYITYTMNELKKGEFVLLHTSDACINKAKPLWHKARCNELNKELEKQKNISNEINKIKI